MDFNIIVAVHQGTNGIGKNNKIVWKCKEDMAHFKKTTENSAIIMGKNTYLSLRHALKNRINIVVSTTLKNVRENFIVKASFDEALNYASAYTDKIFVIGGEKLYLSTINDIRCKKIIISYIVDENLKMTDFDTFFVDVEHLQNIECYTFTNIECYTLTNLQTLILR